MALARSNDVKRRDQPDAETVTKSIRSGDIRSISRLITLVENRHSDGIAALRLLGSPARRAAIVGITGYPGAGKSTLANGLIAAYRRVGKKVAVLAIDTSSPLTGGAVLGDRVRMQDHAGDPGVYIRSMASRGHRGGLAQATNDVVTVLEAAGYEVILIETIGVGQNEIDIADVAQTVVVVVAPGLGDEIQAMKAGLLEIAHIVVVNKSDLPGADRTLSDLREWCRLVIPATAIKGEGIKELMAAIADHAMAKDLAVRLSSAKRKLYAGEENDMPHLLLTISTPIARITLQNPSANVLNEALLKELEETLGEIEQDASVRVVILTGAGRFFCAGADIHELIHLNTVQLGIEFAKRGQELLNRIERCHKPVVAAINGTCVGGGLELALACHIRIAAAGAVLGLPETKLGLIPGFGGTQRLPRIVGSSKAAEMILTGESISADEALKIGLVSRVVPAQQVLAEAEALAGLIASRGAAAVRGALQAMNGGLDISLAEGLAREAELFGQLCITADKQEATKAFLEKRQPRMAETETVKTVARSS